MLTKDINYVGSIFAGIFLAMLFVIPAEASEHVRGYLKKIANMLRRTIDPMPTKPKEITGVARATAIRIRESLDIRILRIFQDLGAVKELV